MNSRDILNKYLYPGFDQNVRRKSFPKYDTLAIATGQTDYYFFQTALGNQYLRNTRLPLSGTEVFFINEISMVLRVNITTVALMNNFNEMMQQGFLQISVDNRVQCKLPILDFLEYSVPDFLTATGTAVLPEISLGKRKLPIPIILNSTSAFEFRLVIPTASATAFNTQTIQLVLHGLQLDKLDSFYWDNLKNNQFQQIPVTYYNTQAIANGNETVYPFFSNPAQAPGLLSQTFPLSDIQTFSLQNFEVYIGNADTPIEGTTQYFSSLQKLLRISIDDIDFYNAISQDMLSIVSMFSTTLTTTPDTVSLNVIHVRNSKTLPVPLEFPANSKVIITLAQPASSLPVTGDITIALRGIETRRVA